MEKVIVYSTQTCPYCHAITAWLDQHQIPYDEKDASLMPDIDVVPVTIVGDKRIIGFDQPALVAALKASGHKLNV